MSIVASHGLMAIVVVSLTGAAYLMKLLRRLDHEEYERRQALQIRVARDIGALTSRPRE